jgi:hypothetical protein
MEVIYRTLAKAWLLYEAGLTLFDEGREISCSCHVVMTNRPVKNQKYNTQTLEVNCASPLNRDLEIKNITATTVVRRTPNFCFVINLFT